MNRQISEVTIGPVVDPETHRTVRFGATFEIVDNERRLRGRSNVELGIGARHLNSKVCPLVGDHIRIRLIFAGGVAAQPIEVTTGEGKILR